MTEAKVKTRSKNLYVESAQLAVKLPIKRCGLTKRWQIKLLLLSYSGMLKVNANQSGTTSAITFWFAFHLSDEMSLQKQYIQRKIPFLPK